MSRRGQSSRYEDDGWTNRGSGHNRINGDYPSSSVNPTSMSRELDELMRIIEADWNIVTSTNYSPVETAMQLMDRSSLGRDYNAFKNLYNRIERSLQFVVNDHFQEFNNSIGLYRGLVLNLTASQERLRKLRDVLGSTKESITKRGGDLLIALNRSQQYKEMLHLLDIMEKLQSVPDKIENLITEKHFTRAVDILSESIKILSQPEFSNIYALHDVSAYLTNQQVSLHDLLVEELHNHLYLKSPYCFKRWASYERGQRQRTNPRAVLANVQVPRKENVSKFVNNLDISSTQSRLGLELLEDPFPNNNIHPESDSFNYIKLIVLALRSLSQVHRAMDTLTQRLPLEVYQLVDKTISEVEGRHSIDLRASDTRQREARTFDGLGKSEANPDVLADLLWTLYSKLAAVLNGHRIVHDCILAIVKESKNKDNLIDTPEYNYIEVWKPIQSEIRSLLLDYLTNNVQATSSIQSTSTSLNEIFTKRGGKHVSKVLFRLDYDHQSNRKHDEDEMCKLLETSVPGLVLQRERINADTSNIGIGRGTMDSTVTGHKLLIAPDPFNIVYLLPPTISFLDRVKELIPSSLTIFLVAVFLPQLEDTVSDAFGHITDNDSYQTIVADQPKFAVPDASHGIISLRLVE